MTFLRTVNPNVRPARSLLARIVRGTVTAAMAVLSATPAPAPAFVSRVAEMPEEIAAVVPGGMAAGFEAASLTTDQAIELIRSCAAPAAQDVRRRGRVVRMRVTAYCACQECCGPQAMGITASGRRVSHNRGRFVAADRALSFCTKLLIPGYASGRPVEVLDRGGAIQGRRLDVFFASHEVARQWGVRYLNVTVLD